MGFPAETRHRNNFCKGLCLYVTSWCPQQHQKLPGGLWAGSSSAAGEHWKNRMLLPQGCTTRSASTQLTEKTRESFGEVKTMGEKNVQQGSVQSRLWCLSWCCAAETHQAALHQRAPAGPRGSIPAHCPAFTRISKGYSLNDTAPSSVAQY